MDERHCFGREWGEPSVLDSSVGVFDCCEGEERGKSEKNAEHARELREQRES
jgi:hypothetical protein